MTPSVPIAEQTPDTERNSHGPHWDHVPFDVACARCGADLRGLSKPICPQCSLHFDWDEALPLEQLRCESCGYHLRGLTETRCPECGERFTWEEALDRHQRRKKKLFEYRWRERPIRSAVRTWWWCVWPPKLWRKIDIHDPPQKGPLIAWPLLCFASFYTALVVLFALQIWIRQYYWAWRLAPRGGRPPSMTYLLQCLLEQVRAPDVYVVVSSTAVWVGCCFGALMVFRQSMRRHKVRTSHVLRVWAYATTTMLPAMVFTIFMLFQAALVGRTRAYLPIEPAVILAFLAHATWSIWRGYGVYLRMPHSFAVAVAAQLMAILGAVTICDTLIPGSFAASLILAICELFGGL